MKTRSEGISAPIGRLAKSGRFFAEGEILEPMNFVELLGNPGGFFGVFAVVATPLYLAIQVRSAQAAAVISAGEAVPRSTVVPLSIFLLSSGSWRVRTHSAGCPR